MVNVSWKSAVDLVNHQTPGDPLTNPYLILPGSDVGLTSPQLQADAETLFPTFSSAKPVTRLPANFNNAALTFAEFKDWHSSVQYKYLADRNATSLILDGHTIVASVEVGKVFIVENMQKRDFAAMNLTDQQNIAATAAFSGPGGLAERYGLVPRPGLTTTATLDQLFLAATGVPSSTADTSVYGWYDDVREPAKTTDRQVFLDQIANLRTRANNSAIIAPDDIKAKLDAIVKRVQRVTEFRKALDRASSSTAEISLDKDQTIQRGYDNFMTQERKMLALDNAKIKLADTGMLKDKKLDAPTLIFLFQQYTSQVTEAVVAADTEESNQLNALLKTYAAIQRLINETSKLFNPKESDQQKGWLGKGEAEVPAAYNSNDDDVAVMQMFNSKRGDYGLSSRIHPLEAFYGVTRPEQNIVNRTNTNKYWVQNYKTAWDAFGTQVSDAVNLLNQEGQIKMNDVNSEQKQQNRHFDLANNALSKLYDILQNITRS